MAEVDSATDGSVPFLFYFHPKDLKELRYLTRRDGFTYPVCFDERDELNRLNGFPADMTFQTFLLDADNRVAAIGNPVHNPDVKRLYLRILTGKADADPGKSLQTTASLGTGEVDFGRFPYGEEQVREVTLRNTGTTALAIHGIDTSCGCTRVEYDKRPLPAGGETKIRIVYAAEETGYFHKTVSIYCNTADSPLRIVVTGTAYK